jgi:hypothetical protein
LSKSKDDFISFGDACSALGILEGDLLQWIKEDNPEIGKDYINKKAIRKSYIEECAQKNDYNAKIEKSFRSENWELNNESENKSQFYQRERSELLSLYATFIGDLTQLHQNYKNTAEFHGPESPVLAAYLLFAKAISTISCLCENLRQGYWYVGSMLREIDETLDVAFYFIITKDNKSGASDLRKWFRLGRSPIHHKCREAISEWHSQLDPSIEKENHKILMSSLYGVKSKFIHPTFQSIRDCSVMSYSNGKVLIESLCYGKSSRLKRLWELTHLTKSSIWTCFQQFLLIFIHSMPLNQKDVDFLLAYDKQFIELDRSWDW